MGHLVVEEALLLSLKLLMEEVIELYFSPKENLVEGVNSLILVGQEEIH
jgi:hypothetical protein